MRLDLSFLALDPLEHRDVPRLEDRFLAFAWSPATRARFNGAVTVCTVHALDHHRLLCACF